MLMIYPRNASLGMPKATSVNILIQISRLGAVDHAKFVSPTILGFDSSARESGFHPLSPASRYLTAQDYQNHFEGANFNIAKIPGLMSSKGCPVGAALMSRWFARSPRIAPDYDPPL